MTITMETVDSLRRKLDELPPQVNAKQAVTKQEAVALLAEKVSKLQARGYAIDEIATILSNNGLPLSVATLKSYLSRARSSSRKRGAKPRRRESGKSAAPGVESAEGKSRKEKRTPAVTPHVSPARIESTTGVGSGGFKPREDSIDI